MKRGGWEERLGAVITQRANWPFMWRDHDCVSFGAACYEAVTGRRIDVPNSYHDELSAHNALKEYAGGGVGEAMEKALGDPKPENSPSDGDIVLCRTHGGDTVGVYAEEAVIVPGKRRLMRYHPKFIRKVWSV